MHPFKMKYIAFIYLLTVFFFNIPASAEEPVCERVYIHTDKDCYIAGEEILFKFLVVNRNFHPSPLSKVGYVEICDAERPQMQLKIALENGSGSGKVKIPANLTSGIYQLSGYTRLMRNEGDSVFFKRKIAILNVARKTDTDRIKLIPTNPQGENLAFGTTIDVKTNQTEYKNRDQVQVNLDHLPEDLIDLTVSVHRNDSLAYLPGPNQTQWLKQVAQAPATPPSLQWLPEYEGHIITGRLTPQLPANQVTANLAFVGNDIRFINGQVDSEGKIYFYTSGIYDSQQIVTSVVPNPDHSCRLDIESPFCNLLASDLPGLNVFPNEKKLIERYIGVQLMNNQPEDSMHCDDPSEPYYNFPIVYSYDLDNYVRFNTLSEVFTEYADWISVQKENGKSFFRVYSEDEHRFNLFEPLVLFDGVPIYDHETILKYNPKHLKKINIYDGKYVFGNVTYECILSFVSYQKDLPFFQLGKESQLFKYDCPSSASWLEYPDYGDEKVKGSRKPDFRHTLYWNPNLKPTRNKPTQFSFYTSDLSGPFEVIVEGITSSGKMIYGSTTFSVKEYK